MRSLLIVVVLSLLVYTVTSKPYHHHRDKIEVSINLILTLLHLLMSILIYNYGHCYGCEIFFSLIKLKQLKELLVGEYGYFAFLAIHFYTSKEHDKLLGIRIGTLAFKNTCHFAEHACHFILQNYDF